MDVFYIIFKQSEEQFRTKDQEEAIEYLNESNKQWEKYLEAHDKEKKRDYPRLFKVIQYEDESEMIEIKTKQDEDQLELLF